MRCMWYCRIIPNPTLELHLPFPGLWHNLIKNLLGQYLNGVRGTVSAAFGKPDLIQLKEVHALTKTWRTGLIWDNLEMSPPVFLKLSYDVHKSTMNWLGFEYLNKFKLFHMILSALSDWWLYWGAGKLWLISGCGGQMNGEDGVFTSPNYPKSYPINVQCVWTIVTVPGDTIELKFNDFHLENSGTTCGYDFVDIRDGSSLDSPLIGKFCSSKIIGRISSTGNSLFIRLKSDGTVSEKGFRASWRSVSHSTSSTLASTPSTQPPSITTTTPVSATLASTTPSPNG